MKRHAIWARIKPEITPAVLKELAACDCGFDADLHLKALQNIYETGTLPATLAWEPREVLCLTSWTANVEGREGYIEILFCCLILLEATTSESSAEYLDGQVEKIIIAIDCAAQLGDVWVEDLYLFLQNIIPRLNKVLVREDWLYFHLGCYILSVLRGDISADNPHIQLVLQAEDDVLEYAAVDKKNKDLMSYTFFDQKRALWQQYLAKTDTALQGFREDLPSYH